MDCDALENRHLLMIHLQLLKFLYPFLLRCQNFSTVVKGKEFYKNNNSVLSYSIMNLFLKGCLWKLLESTCWFSYSNVRKFKVGDFIFFYYTIQTI